MPRWQNLKNPREEKFIRGYSVYVGGGCGEFPGITRNSKVSDRNFKRNHQALLSRHHRFVHPGPAARQSEKTTSISILTKRHLRYSQLRFHYEWGGKRTSDVGTLQKMIIDFFRAAGGKCGAPMPSPIARAPACMKSASAAWEIIQKLPSATSGPDSRRPEPLYMRREHLPHPNRQNHHHAAGRLHHAQLRPSPRKFPRRRPQNARSKSALSVLW